MPPHMPFAPTSSEKPLHGRIGETACRLACPVGMVIYLLEPGCPQRLILQHRRPDAGIVHHPHRLLSAQICIGMSFPDFTRHFFNSQIYFLFLRCFTTKICGKMPGVFLLPALSILAPGTCLFPKFPLPSQLRNRRFGNSGFATKH